MIALISGLFAECPPSGPPLSPCKCYDDYFYCSGNQALNLSEIFSSLSKNASIQKHYKQFYLNNTFISELSINLSFGILGGSPGGGAEKPLFFASILLLMIVREKI